MIKGQPQDNSFSQRCLHLRSLLRQVFERTHAKHRDELCALYMQPRPQQYPFGMYLGASAEHAQATGDYRQAHPPVQEAEGVVPVVDAVRKKKMMMATRRSMTT